MAKLKKGKKVEEEVVEEVVEEEVEETETTQEEVLSEEAVEEAKATNANDYVYDVKAGKGTYNNLSADATVNLVVSVLGAVDSKGKIIITRKG